MNRWIFTNETEILNLAELSLTWHITTLHCIFF